MPQSLDKIERLKLKHPFCDGRFHRLIEKANLLGEETGWQPFFVETEQTVLPGYLKSHSYGEYIFDWAWADFYQKMGRSYYPKIVHALPYTPINSPKVLGPDLEDVLLKARDYYLENEVVSSQHFLFTNKNENEVLLDNDFLLKETIQYHFKNKYNDFDDFLSNLKNRKRKNIRKERKAIFESDLEIVRKFGNELTAEEAASIYQLYLTTIDKNRSYAYLNKSFFDLAPEFLDKNLLIYFAKKDQQIIAMSLFVYGEECLYGRYWGIKTEFEGAYPFLHFELCYYRGMEFCFERKIPLFEAGAQGEHKLLRGFEPKVITSCHHIREPSIRQVIKNHLIEHNHFNKQAILQMAEHLPYK